MNDRQAQDWLEYELGVSRETILQLGQFVEYLKLEAASQNLISASTVEQIWSRHIVDSAQLLHFVPPTATNLTWLDLGSGAGFPGLVIAMLSEAHVTLVESRARRIEYLQSAVEMLDLSQRVKVAGLAVERLEPRTYSVISARAFAPLPKLFDLASRFSSPDTLWLLPKGRNAQREWEEAKRLWTGDFDVMHSVTDPEAGIIVGKLLGRRSQLVGVRGQGQTA